MKTSLLMLMTSLFGWFLLFCPTGLFAQAPVPSTTVHGQMMNETSEEFAAKATKDCLADANLNCAFDKDETLLAVKSGKRIEYVTEGFHSDTGALLDRGVITDGWAWTFDHNHLVKVSFTDHHEGIYDTFLKQAVGKYGKPTVQGTTEWQNGFGARYTMSHATWIQPDGAVVTLVERPWKNKTAVDLTVLTKEEFAALEKALPKAPKL